MDSSQELSTTSDGYYASLYGDGETYFMDSIGPGPDDVFLNNICQLNVDQPTNPETRYATPLPASGPSVPRAVAIAREIENLGRLALAAGAGLEGNVNPNYPFPSSSFNHWTGTREANQCAPSPPRVPCAAALLLGRMAGNRLADDSGGNISMFDGTLMSFTEGPVGPFDQLPVKCPGCSHDFYLKTSFIYNGLNPNNTKEQEIKSRFGIAPTGLQHPFGTTMEGLPFASSPPHYIDSPPPRPAARTPSPANNDFGFPAQPGNNDFVFPAQPGWEEEEQFGGEIEMEFHGGIFDAPQAAVVKTGYLAPQNLPHEFASARHHSYDRMEAECPYCRHPLHVKVGFTYLGVNSVDTQEHEVKISVNISSAQQAPLIRPFTA